MTSIPTAPRARRTRRVLHRDLRAAAAEVGIDETVAATTPHDDLAAVIHLAPRLRVVPDVDITETWAEQMLADGHTPDEVESVATFRRGRLVESAFASADDRTPWDEFDPAAHARPGGDAA